MIAYGKRHPIALRWGSLTSRRKSYIDLSLILLCFCAVVKDLLLWRDVKKSGIVFGSSLVVLLSLALFSIISVVSYLSLAVLTMTASFRIYHLVRAAFKQTEPINPYRYSICSATA